MSTSWSARILENSRRRPLAVCPRGPRSRAGATLVGMVEYEYRVLTLPPRLPRADVRALLAAEAEYGQWELSRHRIYMGGMRRVWLRRRIIRVPRPS